MNIILFDDEGRTDLLPLCYTRPCADLRVGILTIADKWSHYLDCKVSYLTQDYLSQKFPSLFTDDNYYVNGRLLPNEDVASAILNLKKEEALYMGGKLIIYRSTSKFSTESLESAHITRSVEIKCETVDFLYDIFSLNGEEIKKDFKILTKDKVSAELSSTNTLIGNEIFAEEDVSIEAAVLNSTNGPIYLGKNSIVLEGSLIKGPFALCEGSTIKMGAKIYGDTTVGPECKVGGEVSNTVFWGRSNKGHDGFLGNSVIGEWCNMGADTNCSNLKNNYAQIKLWNYTKSRFLNTSLQFCGLIMGDHSKCGINTMFNTGTVVGVSANIFGASFPRNFIPSFTWGGATGFATYTETKAFETARLVMQRRSRELDEQEKNILIHIFNDSSKQRFWENRPLNT